MLSDGKNWIAMPASFMASQSWKDSLQQQQQQQQHSLFSQASWGRLEMKPTPKKNGRISEEIRLKFLVLIASCLITVQVRALVCEECI